MVWSLSSHWMWLAWLVGVGSFESRDIPLTAHTGTRPTSATGRALFHRRARQGKAAAHQYRHRQLYITNETIHNGTINRCRLEPDRYPMLYARLEFPYNETCRCMEPSVPDFLPIPSDLTDPREIDAYKYQALYTYDYHGSHNLTCANQCTICLPKSGNACGYFSYSHHYSLAWPSQVGTPVPFAGSRVTFNSSADMSAALTQHLKTLDSSYKQESWCMTFDFVPTARICAHFSSYYNDHDEDGGITPFECSVEVNNVTCNSCSFVEYSSDADEDGVFCILLDCANIEMYSESYNICTNDTDTDRSVNAPYSFIQFLNTETATATTVGNCAATRVPVSATLAPVTPGAARTAVTADPTMSQAPTTATRPPSGTLPTATTNPAAAAAPNTAPLTASPPTIPMTSTTNPVAPNTMDTAEDSSLSFEAGLAIGGAVVVLFIAGLLVFVLLCRCNSRTSKEPNRRDTPTMEHHVTVATEPRVTRSADTLTNTSLPVASPHVPHNIDALKDHGRGAPMLSAQDMDIGAATRPRVAVDP